MEVEAKFSVPDEQTFQRLLGATRLAGFSLAEGSVAELHDRYLDTAEATMRAAGYACRLRRQDGRYLATIKGLGMASGAIHRRIEYEVGLPEPLLPRDWPPSDARDLALGLCGNDPLIPLFEIEQTRHSRPLHEGDRIIAALNLDRVRVCQGNDMLATYRELEAELLPDGSEKDLERLVIELEAAWELVPQSFSKFQRALALVSAGLAPGEEAAQDMEAYPQPVELLENPGIEPDDPMSEAGRKTFRFHYRRMLYHEPGTRLGEDIEALHDMRVATRRMRAAFRVFGAYYEPQAVAPYLKGLKRTGRALGPVRDLDVFRAKIQAYLDTLPASQQGSLDDLLAVLEVQREATRERMIAYLDGEKYARFKARFGEFVETEGMGSLSFALDGGEPRPYRVRHVVPVAIYRRLAAVRAYDEWVSIPDPPLARLHALRIACKRLRYTLEFFGEVLEPDTKTLVKEIVAMQDHLGALQDAVVASGILRDFLEWGTWGHDADQGPPAPEAAVVSPGVEAYLAAKQSELQHLVETFPQSWQHLKGADFSQMVAKAVMVL